MKSVTRNVCTMHHDNSQTTTWLNSLNYAHFAVMNFYAERKAFCNGHKEDNTRDVASDADLRNIRQEVVYDEVKEMTTHDHSCEVNIAYNALTKVKHN